MRAEVDGHRSRQMSTGGASVTEFPERANSGNLELSAVGCRLWRSLSVEHSVALNLTTDADRCRARHCNLLM